MSERFNEIAKDWDKSDFRQVLAQSVFQTITSRLALLSSMDIMDFGSGTGLLSFRVSPLVRKVVGVDVSSGMIEQMQQKCDATSNVHPICQNIMEEPLNQKFHGIVSSMAMHHVEDTAALIQTFAKHLHKDGFIAIADLEEEDGTFHQHGNDGVHHLGFNKEALRSLVEKNGFHTVRFTTAYTMQRDSKEYPIFLMVAIKI